jgi:uncharacterized protein YjbI with pentapeptide repeats
MYLKSVSGETLFKSSHITIKEAVEEAVAEGVCLKSINLRKAKLEGAQIDMAKMPGACFWGADLTSADMSDGCFDEADFRTATLKDSCLSEGSFIGANFHGAHCSQMLIDGTNFSNTRFSCPSIFSCDLGSVSDLGGAIYSHHGEVDCLLSSAPIIIRGLDQPVVIMGQDILIGSEHNKMGGSACHEKEILDQLRRKLFYNHK